MSALLPPEAEELFAEIVKARLGPSYTEIDRYRDFRQLFLSSDQGKRVLYQLLGWGHMVQSSAGLANNETNRTFLIEGERNLALRILRTIYVEPKPKPTQATSRPTRTERKDHG